MIPVTSITIPVVARHREQPEFPDYPCLCYGPGAECLCTRTERALRTIALGEGYALTVEQRDYCRVEIASVEGYSESDADGPDAQVARTTLNAWRDYCRGLGIL